MQNTNVSVSLEQKILAIIRKLPPEQNLQLFDFARFLASDTFKAGRFALEDNEDAQALDQTNTVTKNDTHWDALFASDESQFFLDKMADEAMAEIRAGKARPIIFTNDGELAATS